jgi:hypothetical protein
LFFLWGVAVSVIDREIAIFTASKSAASGSEFENGSLGMSRVRRPAGAPRLRAREQF